MGRGVQGVGDPVGIGAMGGTPFEGYGKRICGGHVGPGKYAQMAQLAFRPAMQGYGAIHRWIG